ncbi:sulfatase-like hydrolase/transferase [Xanthomarina gelatinilytica]|uniref:sulfatase-like hydrolase/transferase n=1 Tax=Xanthomarina gelatinilytica TaxID=1137281 RepID=UPI003AA911CC
MIAPRGKIQDPKTTSQEPFHRPITLALAAGLYPLLFYYSRNFTMIDSWAHLGYFLMFFLGVPLLLFLLATWILNRFNVPFGKYVLPFMNLVIFFFFLKIILFTGAQKKIMLGAIIISACAVYFLHKHMAKWIMIQFLLACIGLITLIPVLIKNLNYSNDWAKQPDGIGDVSFNKKPNIYYIQPDGYVNFSELERGYYNYKQCNFKSFLTENGFKNYPDFRSNYDATLASNSATFAMKHHFYTADAGTGEIVKARNIIMGDNAVLDILKKNGYKTYFFAEYPYLLMNRPKLGYDYVNYNYSEIPFMGTGLENRKEILPEFINVLDRVGENQPKFFFIEIFNPTHIDGSSVGKNLVAKKRNQYLENLKKADNSLTDLIGAILKRDPNALILIMADHGGYVGMERFQQGNEKTEDSDKIYSMFSSILSVHWPENSPPSYDEKFKSPINVFRILFSFLSEDASYLNHLEKDSSYGLILEGAPQGVYELIDERYETGFKEIN